MLALPRGGVPAGIEGIEALKALEWLHLADQRLFGTCLAGRRRSGAKSNRGDPRFDIKALCLQAVDAHGERPSGRLFCHQGQKGECAE